MSAPSNERRRTRRAKRRAPKQLRERKPSDPLGRDPGWDAVDEASYDSFPASDPPSYWAGSDAPTEAALRAARDGAEGQQNERARRSPS